MKNKEKIKGVIFMRKIIHGVETLVKDGVFNFGTYDKSFNKLNILETNVFYNIKPIKYMRLKEWHAFQIGNDRYFIFIALMDIKKAAFLEVNIYDKKKYKKYLYKKNIAPWKIRLPYNLLDSTVSYNSYDFKISVNNQLNENKISINFNIKGKNNLPNVKGEFIGLAGKAEPIVSCIPFGENRGMYSYKGNFPMKGLLYIDNEAIEFSYKTSFFTADDQKGYYPYIMAWDWVTASGYNNNRLIGFNLTRNQSIDQEEYNENCMWINGKLHLLPAVKFTRVISNNNITWIIRDEKGIVNLKFLVEEENREYKNYLVIKSRYSGPFGVFNGYIMESEGKMIKIDNMFGMGEEFYLRC
jgi:hypothetical protein